MTSRMAGHLAMTHEQARTAVEEMIFLKDLLDGRHLNTPTKLSPSAEAHQSLGQAEAQAGRSHNGRNFVFTLNFIV